MINKKYIVQQQFINQIYLHNFKNYFNYPTQIPKHQFYQKMSALDSPKRNQSMDSTMYRSSFIGQKSQIQNLQDNQQALPSYSYANIPISKQTPRWLQSSATLRHSSHRYSFSKDNRFRVRTPYYLDFLQPEMPSTNTAVSCTFGKGTKKPISEVILRNAKQKPSPDRYDLTGFDESPRKAEKGKTFGIGWSKFQKVLIDHRKDVYSGHFTSQNPPAKYDVRQVPGGNKRKFTAYGRLEMFSQKMAKVTKDIPGPHHKIRDRHLYAMSGLNQRNFSFGQRIDFTKPANEFPGAKYLIPGFCDKFNNLKDK